MIFPFPSEAKQCVAHSLFYSLIYKPFPKYNRCMDNKSKTSKLAIFSAGCSIIVAFLVIVVFPWIGYMDDVKKSGPGTIYDDLPGIAVLSALIYFVMTITGTLTGLRARSKIKKSNGEIKGQKIATISIAVCTIPFILFVVVQLLARAI
jgi:membrane-bound metal-dependent hydrolase YbcI (DUF457 family)